MINFLPSFIMALREGLEAFLIVSIIFRYLDRINLKSYKKNVWLGIGVGVFISLLLGLGLEIFSNQISDTDTLAKIWESLASIFAVLLVTTFIIWMINHGREMTKHVETEISRNISKMGIFLITTIMIAREGAEIAIFSFAGQFGLFPVLLGILAALLISILIYFSLLKVNLNIFMIGSLIYIILQGGFLLGYGVHEGLHAVKELGLISSDSFLLNKAYDLSGTVLNHKEGILGIPLYILTGWYSKPEWIQLILQYLYIILMSIYWYFNFGKRNEKN